MSTTTPFSIRQWLAGLPAGSIGWVFVASGLLFLIGAAYYTVTGLAHDRSLAEKGRHVDGVVLTKSVGTEREDHSKRTYYYVEYRFSVLGEPFTDRVEVNKDVWDRLHEQGPIRVTYLPDAPEVHQVEGQEAGFLLWKVALFLGGAGLFFYVGRLLLAGKLQLSASEPE